MPLRASWLSGIKDSKYFRVLRTKLSHLENQNFQHLSLGYIIHHHRLNNLFSWIYYMLGPEQQRPPKLIPRHSLVFPIILRRALSTHPLPASKVEPFLFPVELGLRRGMSILVEPLMAYLDKSSWEVLGLPHGVECCKQQRTTQTEKEEIPQLRPFRNFFLHTTHLFTSMSF